MSGTENQSAPFVVCNIDGVPVGDYDSLLDAKDACHDLARQAAFDGDLTNGYHVQDVSDFDGYLAADFAAEVTF